MTLALRLHPNSGETWCHCHGPERRSRTTWPCFDPCKGFGGLPLWLSHPFQDFLDSTFHLPSIHCFRSFSLSRCSCLRFFACHWLAPAGACCSAVRCDLSCMGLLRFLCQSSRLLLLCICMPFLERILYLFSTTCACMTTSFVRRRSLELGHGFFAHFVPQTQRLSCCMAAGAFLIRGSFEPRAQIPGKWRLRDDPSQKSLRRSAFLVLYMVLGPQLLYPIEGPFLS